MRRSPSTWLAALALAALGTRAAPAAAQQAQGVLRGTVTDSATRQPIEGARIEIVGTTGGALTGASGEFVVRGIPAGARTVRALRIGYASQSRAVTLRAGDTTVANFTLHQVARQLSEELVVGYGTASRREVSTSVSSLQGAEIQNAPVAGLDAAMQGKAPGVQVTQNAGNPGNGISVRIRGAASLSASNQPLYVIDGVPMLREDYSQLGMGGQDITAVTGISPDEIASLDILKDAAAAAIYGSRASNGVVLITTKRGSAGRPKFGFNMYAGSQRLERRLDLLNAREYVKFFNEAAKNDGYDEEDYPFVPGVDDTVRTDWQNEIYRTARVADANLNVSGGTDRIQYFVSGAYFNQDGIVIGSDYNRANARVNLDFTANSRLSFRSSIGLTREVHGRVQGDNDLNGIVTNAIAEQPNVPVRLPGGDFTSTDDGLEYSNPVALGRLNSAESRVLRTMGSLDGVLNLTDRLKFTSRVGLDILNVRDLRWESSKIIGTYAASISGVAEQGNNTATRYLLENFLSFDRSSPAYGNLSLTGGGSVEYNTAELDWLRGEGFGSEQFRYVGNAGKVTDYDGGKTQNNLTSLFARANYSLLDRYFLTGSIRRDGSSRFGQGHKYGTFPAASLGWMLTDEPMLSGLPKFGDFKVRVSYGVTGNQGIGDDFAHLPRYSKANYADEPGIAPDNIGNSSLKWETTHEFDVGFDLSVFGGRLSIVGDKYTKTTNDQLVFRPISRTTGYSAFWDNIGEIENRGYELQVTTVNFDSRVRDGLKWTTDFNISWNHNEVTALFNGEPFNSGLRSTNRVEVGQPLGAFQALQFTGVDPETGNAIYKDVDGDGEITSADRVIVGSPHPKYWGGLTNAISAAGFEVRGFLSFSQGAKIFNGMRIFADDGGYYFDNKLGSVRDRWRKPGDKTNVPRASYDGTSGAREISSRFIEDGSYVRLQEIMLSYRLPARLVRVGSLTDATLFVSGRNLKTWTDYSGYNPDVNSNGSSANVSLGTDFYAYPLARTWTIGVRGAW